MALVNNLVLRASFLRDFWLQRGRRKGQRQGGVRVAKEDRCSAMRTNCESLQSFLPLSVLSLASFPFELLYRFQFFSYSFNFFAPSHSPLFWMLYCQPRLALWMSVPFSFFVVLRVQEVKEVSNKEGKRRQNST